MNTEKHITIANFANARVDIICSNGANTDFFDQAQAEVACVIAGQAQLEFDDGSTLLLRAGDHCLLAPHRRHRVKATSADCRWLCIYGDSPDSAQWPSADKPE